MATEIIMPKMEMSQETAQILEWLKKEGERVEKGEALLVVETDKVTVEIESPASGILAGVKASAGERVPVTSLIGYLLQPGESLPETAKGVTGSPSEEEGAGGLLATIHQASRKEAADRAVEQTEVRQATPIARRMAKEAGLSLQVIRGSGPAGRIRRADVEAAMAAGLAGEITFEAGAGKVRATPAARRIARLYNLDLIRLSGSGYRGRIQAADVRRARDLLVEGSEDVKIVPLRGMRRTIAERMQESYRTAPHISFLARMDMTAFEDLRHELNLQAEKSQSGSVSVTALLVKIVAGTLQRNPWLNASLKGEEIHVHRAINIGVAVALREGLIVPVVHQADRKEVLEIASEVAALADKARQGRLELKDVARGTFTISNLGPLGVEQFTAIINPGQSGILAVGAVTQEPVVMEGQVTIRPIMRMNLSADHRVVDGAVAAHFMNDLRQALGSPSSAL
jgi:pyruvate dehydrogenase E2 component (dihydrolipoamide acetyltransferase)